ncbi:DUF86 domain-containing protein [Ectobacillus antri]|uniref:DUF86 domain-containing protein n=1 Tax=Ectobacillus antri TaxID=2486280 RepID=A0ABT6H7J3_9BACI|nr:HepT-like ribonuclease domain-containing protein [Ectobacillus antri]MDG4658226.1 DUF86 domain-containing protein [Ectobacillus antri]MDG5755312.1 DUF86 domain-containing protein [Ectobacillus antri]
MRGLEIIGETMNRIPREFQSKYPEVSWRDWIAFRNVLIHVYHAVDLELVWETMKDELQPLRKQMASIVEKES